jgi:RNA polymerase sigma-70 factor (ECF subfamily)
MRDNARLTERQTKFAPGIFQGSGGSMEKTPASLIVRLQSTSDGKAYEEFVAVFFPLMMTWSSRLQVPAEEAEDFIHEVFITVLRRLPTFHYDPTGSFRGWLYGIMRNKDRERLKAKRSRMHGRTDLDEMPDERDMSEVDDACYAREVVHGALGVIRSQVSPKSFRAFELHQLEGKPGRDVAEQLGMTREAVHKAVSRIKQRLRTLLEGIVDW